MLKPCKKEYTLSESVIENLSQDIQQTLTKNTKLASKRGCEKCNFIGYKGRAGIFEVMEVSDLARDMIIMRRSAREIAECAVKEGMGDLLTSGVKKAMEKVTSLEEVMRIMPSN